MKNRAFAFEPDNATLALWIPLCGIILLDYFFTIICQPAEYWSDTYARKEGNIAGKILLENGALTFILIGLLWMFVLYFILKIVSRDLKFIIFIGLLAANEGHGYGAWTWISDIAKFIFRNLPWQYSESALIMTSVLYWIIILLIGYRGWEKYSARCHLS